MYDLGRWSEKELLELCSGMPIAANPLKHFHSAVGSDGYSYETRRMAVDKWSWAIPDEKALKAIQKYAPILEIGAGRGYWAALLRARGVDVKAYDSHPVPNHYHRTGGEAYTAVHRGRPRCAERFAGHALFLCWPVYAEPMAAECLRRYKGDTVIYVGEGYGGCTGDDNFHSMLSDQFEEIEVIHIPQWKCVYDNLTIWKRK